MTAQFSKTNYILQSVHTKNKFEDTGWVMVAPGEDMSTLVRAIYEKKQIEVKDDSFGLYKFADWLPISHMLKGSSAPVTYKSEGLAKELGLTNLWVTFSGYWPEKGANMQTCSFKETEAYSVCGRLPLGNDKILNVASAGNTARAFAKVCSDNNIPLILCVPEDNLDALWFEKPLNDCVKLICSEKGCDYFDAISLSNHLTNHEKFLCEGGARNVARRDGMSTTVLSAATTIGKIPDYYFQAIGSGTGAVAAWEANMRLLEDGRYGNTKMKLMVSQNSPFVPIHDAWKANSRDMLPLDDDQARTQVEEIIAKVLSNRKPAYGIFGGLFDALNDAGGDVLTATNQESVEASELFKKLEGIDIHPAAGIATASLINAVKNKTIDKDALVMLNITGGGEERFKQEKELFYLKPSHIFKVNPDAEEVVKIAVSLFEE